MFEEINKHKCVVIKGVRDFDTFKKLYTDLVTQCDCHIYNGSLDNSINVFWYQIINSDKSDINSLIICKDNKYIYWHSAKHSDYYAILDNNFVCDIDQLYNDDIWYD